MSILKIKDICLCTGLVKDNNENRTAYDFLTANNVNFQHLAYWDISQHPLVWQSLQSWDHTKTIDTFPILHYHEIDDEYNIRPVVFVGLSEILGSNVVELSKL